MSYEPKLEANDASLKELIVMGMASFEAGKYAEALDALEQIPPYARPVQTLSALGYSVAVVRSGYKVATQLCNEAIKKDSKNPEHYFQQGRIYLLAGRKKDAIWVFRMGLRNGKHKGIINALGALGIRRPPPINFLDRRNPLNKAIGIILTRLNLR